jgi:hypothetical protein
MSEPLEIGEDELVGVEVRNTNFIKINGLTWEEVQDTFEIIKTLFNRRGYLYLREANRMFKDKIEALKNNDLVAENLSLKQKLEEKGASRVPKTLGK